jgi:hypothetical protein
LSSFCPAFGAPAFRALVGGRLPRPLCSASREKKKGGGAAEPGLVSMRWSLRQHCGGAFRGAGLRWRHCSSSPLQSLCPGARRGILWSRPPSLRALANASPTLESAPALPAAALPREVAAKAPPTHLYHVAPPPSVSPGLTASSPPTAPASGRAMVPPLALWRRLPWRWSPVALALAALRAFPGERGCGWAL